MMEQSCQCVEAVAGPLLQGVIQEFGPKDAKVSGLLLGQIMLVASAFLGG